MARTELFILNTHKVDDDLNLFFRYKIYDDNDALTESGIKYRKYEDDMEVSDNGVYLDSVGFYTKDDDDNKVYQEGSVYTLCNYFYDITKNNMTLTLQKTDNDPEVVDIEWTDFDKDGKYTHDDDDITVNVDLGNRIVNWTPKNGDKGVIGISIGIGALYFINEDMNQQQMLNHQFENITQKQGLVLESKDNDILNKIDDKEVELENKIDSFIVDFATLNGSDGALLKDGAKVKLSNFSDIIWTIDKSFHYTNDRGIVKIAYKLYADYVNNNGETIERKMIVDQNLISEVVAS